MTSRTPNFTQVKTPFTNDELSRAKITPVTKTTKVFWGLWSRSSTEIYIFLPDGLYKMNNKEQENDGKQSTDHPTRTTA